MSSVIYAYVDQCVRSIPVVCSEVIGWDIDTVFGHEPCLRKRQVDISLVLCGGVVHVYTLK